MARDDPYASAELSRYGEPEPGGTGVDWRTQASYLGFPLVHVAFGKDAEGKRRVATGVVAIGQYAVGAITIAQFGVALLFGVGQLIVGFSAVAQVAVAVFFGAGQIATGYVAIGQIAAGYYVLAQIGFGKYLWTPAHDDPQAVDFFRQLWEQIKAYFQ